MGMQEFKIIPILGLKNDVLANDISLFKPIGDNVALTHAVAGDNFSLSRQKNACSKSNYRAQYTSSGTAGGCFGLFELYDGINRDFLVFHNGTVYVDDGDGTMTDVSPAAVTLANDNTDLYSIIKVGSHAVFADRAEHTPYCWKNADANATKLITSGTEFLFRYLVYFSQRIIGLYSTATNGDIDIRWSNVLPVPSTSCEFAAANQLFCPNDDPITGVALLGNRCIVYCENSINEIVYYPDYSMPFRIYTVVPNQGCTGHHSIVNMGNKHYFFNRDYGFCEYSGGNRIIPISDDISGHIDGIGKGYYNLIVGVNRPSEREVVWSVPLAAATSPDHLLFYNDETKQWTVEDKEYRYIDYWNIPAGSKLVYSNDAEEVYYQASDHTTGVLADRTEPIMKFGNNKSVVQEVWFDFAEVNDFTTIVSIRSADTIGELLAKGWSVGIIQYLGTPYLGRVEQLEGTVALYHQIKWVLGSSATKKAVVNSITFRYTTESTR